MGTTFSFSLSLGRLPSWCVPGPLPVPPLGESWGGAGAATGGGGTRERGLVVDEEGLPCLSARSVETVITLSLSASPDFELSLSFLPKDTSSPSVSLSGWREEKEDEKGDREPEEEEGVAAAAVCLSLSLLDEALL